MFFLDVLFRCSAWYVPVGFVGWEEVGSLEISYFDLFESSQLSMSAWLTVYV
jgi:hypothetical protein